MAKNKIGCIEFKRCGNKIYFYSNFGRFAAENKILDIREAILKVEETLILEMMPDEYLKRLKKVVDSEWMRRNNNGSVD